MVGVDQDRGRVERARATLTKAAAYGVRITLHHVASLDRLSFPHSFANLIVTEACLAGGEFLATADRVIPLLQPVGGVAWLGPLRGASWGEAERRAAPWLGATTAR